MAIKKSNADIPRGAETGNPPDPHPRFGPALAEAWGELNAAEFHQKSRTDVEHYIRLGWGGMCARLIGYRLLGVEESNPTDLAGHWRMGLGTMVHGGLQETLQRAFPGAEMEKVVDATHDEIMGLPTSGRTDVFIVEQVNPLAVARDIDGNELNGAGEVIGKARRICIEVKTINGFGYKKAVGARGVPEGPRSGALFQAALNGRAHGADEVVVVYLSLECLSDRELTALVGKVGGEPASHRKFVAEWTWSMSDLDEMVDRELARLAKILKMTDDYVLDDNGDGEVIGAKLPPRSIPLEMPARARVTDPSKGAWQVVVNDNVMDSGETWMCGYCDYQDQCVKDGPS